MKESKYETSLKDALNQKPKVSAEFEVTLFAQAEVLLAARREYLALREASVQDRKQAGSHWLNSARQILSDIWELFAIHPNLPATAAMLATLVFAFVALHQGNEPAMSLSYSDLPALPKYNDAPANYDAQLLAERQAYEREIDDAHKKTSGGN